MSSRPAVAILLLLLASTAHAQWTADGTNLSLADGANGQVLPRIVAIPSGGTYVAWFDNRTGGHDVYIQRLDARGVELWAHNGVLVADRSFSSVQGWGIDVDAAGNALLAFRDDRFGAVRTTAAKVTPDGTLAWGPNGIQLSAGTTDVSSPDIAGATDGDVVVAWGSDDDVRLQRLDPAGVPQWPGDVVLTDAGGNRFSVSDLNASDDGNVIVSMVLGFFGATLHAQKLSSDGDPLWGATPVAVFDGGALQIGNFPTFVTDGAGGAVFGWYSSSPSLQCFAQRVNADGSERFPHNGVAGSTVGSRIRVNPSVGFAGNETFLFWVEENTGQSQFGIYGQKFDDAGARQWTDAGSVVVPVGATEHGQVRTLADGGGATVLFVDKPSPPFGQRVLASRVDGNGDFVWPDEIIEASSVVAGKSRLTATLDDSGAAVLAWSDERTDGGDIYAQNVTAAGTLGVPGDADGDGDVDFEDILILLAAWGDCPAEGECPADFNGDGVVSFADLLVVLGNWG